MKTMPLGYSVYSENDNPIFGDSATTIKIEDEAAGPFIVLEQFNDDVQKLKFDFDEIEILFSTIKKLMKECDYES